MHPNDDDKTGFKILRRTFAFNKMPFWLCNAPTTFQMAMDTILKGVSNVWTYFDDILVFPANRNEHYRHLKVVLDLRMKSGVSINFEKSKFAGELVSYFGHVITPEEIKLEITKIKGFEQRSIRTKKTWKLYMIF